MKIRRDFVTNSSSSSFVINKKDLTSEQISLLTDTNKLIDLIKQKYGVPCQYDFSKQWNDERLCYECKYYICEADGWEIKECGDKIVGYTIMDNFDMIDFLTSIGIPIAAYNNSGSGINGLAWIYDNYKINPFGFFKDIED